MTTTPDLHTLTKPGALQKWIEELPYANPAGVVKEVLSALQQLNQHPKEIPNQRALMDLFLPPFEYIIKDCEEIVLHQRGTSSIKRSDQRFLELAEDAIDELAFGFKRCVKNSLLGHKTQRVDMPASLIFWTMHYLGLVRLFAFSYYRDAPSNTWRDIGNLYRLSQKLKLSSQPVSARAMQSASESTIEREFVRIILMTLIDPSKLSHDNIWRTYEYLGIWGPQARFIDQNSAQHSEDYFLVDMTTADVIKPYDPSEPPADNTHYLILDTSLLNYLIEDQISSLDSDPEYTVQGIGKLDSDHAAQLLRQMHRNWHGRPERQFDRVNQRDRLTATRGLSAVCYFLEQHALKQRQPKVDENPLETTLSFDANGTWPSTPTKISYDTFTWHQANISKGGMAILSHTSLLNGPYIGQIILAKSESQKKSSAWRIGVVRRAKQKSQNIIELGIEFLHGKIIPIEQRPEIFGRTEQADYQSALLYVPKDKNAYVLITPPHAYQPDSIYVIANKKGDTKRMRAGALLESSCFFEQFECFPIQLHGEDE